MEKTKNDHHPKRRRVGLIYDERMCKHKTPEDEENHPENPHRIRAIWERLNASGLSQRCIVLNAKEADDNQLSLVHSQLHIDSIKTFSCVKSVSRLVEIAAEYDSIYFSEGSSEAAILAAGSVIEAAVKVASGELDSAFAIVRPPGHHAEEDEPMGFCLYNNVAVAASFLLNERTELGIKKILIVDWDVHHGNGTQKMFYNEPRVLYFSVHRHENGSFYPYGDDGSYVMTGEGPGVGYNINVPWGNGGCGDSDYIAVWDHILLPVAKEFDPDMIIISAGFDAAIGDPMGGCLVSPYGYSTMLDMLRGFARGKIVMALEGGYNPISLANSAESCIEALLQERPHIRSLEALPLKSTWLVILKVRELLSAYWPVLSAKLPDEVINRGITQIEDDLGVKHAIHHKGNASSNLQSDTEVEEEVGEDLSADTIGAQPHSPVLQPCGNPVPPTSRDQAPTKTDAFKKGPPIAAGSAPSKRARLDEPTGKAEMAKSYMDIPVPDSLNNYVLSKFLDNNHSLFDGETLQRLSREADRDVFKGISIEDRVDMAFNLFADAMNCTLDLCKTEQCYENRVIELEERLKVRDGELETCKDEVSRLREKNKKLAAALHYEIATGNKFLESKAGKERLEEVKIVAVDQFKKSEPFHDEIVYATSRIYTEAIDLHRERRRSSGVSRSDL